MAKKKTSQPKYLDDAFEKVCKQMLETFIKKHKDYGKGNITDTGELGILFRINDKVNRLKNLLMNNKCPENEPIDDDWMDIAVYAVIARLVREGWFEELELNPKK